MFPSKLFSTKVEPQRRRVFSSNKKIPSIYGPPKFCKTILSHPTCKCRVPVRGQILVKKNFGHRSFTVNSQRFLAQDNLGPTLPCPYALVSPMQYANNQIPLGSRGFTIFFKENTLNNGVTGLFVYYNRLAISIPSLRSDFNSLWISMRQQRKLHNSTFEGNCCQFRKNQN
jgi:hypothetical protein